VGLAHLGSKKGLFCMNFYSLLGIEQHATPKQIKKAYQDMVLKIHPDKGGEKEAFLNIKEAYECLISPTQKLSYDMELRESIFNEFIKLKDVVQTNGVYIINCRCGNAAKVPDTIDLLQQIIECETCSCSIEIVP
jgi:curved DNA-binding protein CbpA